MKKLLLVILLFPLLGISQAAERWNTALVPKGSGSNFATVIPNAQISVCQYNTQLQCTSLVAVYSDPTLSGPLTQPFPANGAGVYQYFVQAGTHVVEKVCAPYAQCSYYNVMIGDTGGSGGSSTIVEVNSTPTNPVSPVNFVDSDTVTFTLSGSNVSAHATSGGGCEILSPQPNYFLFLNSDGTGCNTNYIDEGATNPNTLTLLDQGIDQHATNGAINLQADGGAVNISSTTAALNLTSQTAMSLGSSGGIVLDDLSSISHGIHLNEDVTGGGNITLNNSGTGDIELNSNGSIAISDSSTVGISISNISSGPITLGAQNITISTTTAAGFTANGSEICTFATGCGASSGVASINTVTGAFTFSFSAGAGSCSGTTCTFTGSGSGGGSVTNFIANTSDWPSWLVPTVTLSTSTPTLAVAASAIPNSALTTQSANTVLGALTATTPSGLAMPSCSGATNALKWTSGTGFGCNTITSSSAFSAITGSTNTTAAMLVGTGASLGPTGSGTITATAMPASGLSGSSLPGGITTASGLTTVAGGTLGTAAFGTLGTSGSDVPQLVSGLLPVAVLPLATGSTFGVVKPDGTTCSVTAGVLTCSAGGIPYPSGSGIPQVVTGSSWGTTFSASNTIPANFLAAIPLTGLATQSGNTVVGNSTASTGTPSAMSMPSCSGSTSALMWTTSTGFGCHTIATTSTFTGITSGTNTVAAMLVGSGSSLGATGTGTITATAMPYTGLTGSVPTWNQTTTGKSAGITGGALGSALYQSAANTTAFISSPTTSGHTYFFGWSPSGSAIDPTAIDMATYLASPAAIGGTTSAAGTFSTLTVNGGGTGVVAPHPGTFGSLTACSGTNEGSIAAVTDSTTNTWGATITGSGSDVVLAFCDGTDWTVAGK